MKEKLLLLITVCTLLISCNEEKVSRPATALDTGRDFIRASLDGNFETAETLLSKDSQNIQLFDSYKTYYNRLPEEKKNNYRKASYNINKYDEVNDSVVIINYSNSYMNKPMEIKVVKDKEWGVDFKFTYSGSSPAE